jgi:AmmeMemoRadiSam system protein A
MSTRATQESASTTGSSTGFTAAQRAAMLTVAERSIAERLRTGTTSAVDERRHELVLRTPGAAFVTLERGDVLLGCIGTLEPVRPLICDVAHNAVAAAFADPRVPAIGRDDYEVMAIELSVLSALQPLDATSLDLLAAELRPGVDGVVVEASRGRATFLPAVWRHFGDDVDMFLGALWRKAGFAPGTWPAGARCSRYTTEQVVGHGPRDA